MSSSLACVLVVEDEALIRMSLVDELEDVGFRVLEAATADEAMGILKNNPNIEAIFTDIDMPGSIDGLKLAKLVGQSHPDMAILLTSGYLKIPKNDLPETVAFIPKPYEIDVVVNHIRELTY
ncbi:MAG: response regulator [Hyphomicrobiales bacterium]|nr:MAG: response regulator [Hyphomicrobiales bacterium]